jgi:hypothetical protein
MTDDAGFTNQDTAIRIYPPERLESYSDKELRALLDLAKFDRDNENTIYGGRTRAATVATAEWSIRDIEAAIAGRAAAEPFTAEERRAEDALDAYMAGDPNA